MKLLAQRDSMPEDLRWTLSLLQSSLGRLSLIDIVEEQANGVRSVDGSNTDGQNEILETFLENKNMLSDSIIHYCTSTHPPPSPAITMNVHRDRCYVYRQVNVETSADAQCSLTHTARTAPMAKFIIA